MTQQKIMPGSTFPTLMAKCSDGSEIELGKPSNNADWKMVVVFRGQHCPVCTMYLNNLENYKERLLNIGIDLVAVSADSETQLAGHKERLNVSYPLCYGLSVDQMQELGLYISHPRSAEETDHPFPEPASFIVNEKGQVEILELANNPAVRPDLEIMMGGLDWIRNKDNDYPIRGTYQ